MKKTTTRRTRPANLSTREIGTLPWSYFVVIAICGCVIAAGFLLAARQHFMSMDLGMKNSALRKQLHELESENRRLTLAREVALSPAEITRTARNLGFVNFFDAAAPALAAQPSPGAINAQVVKASAPAAATPRAAITKTAFHRPANAGPDKERSVKKSDGTKNSARPDLNTVAKR